MSRCWCGRMQLETTGRCSLLHNWSSHTVRIGRKKTPLPACDGQHGDERNRDED